MLPLLVVFSLLACITACPGNGLYSGVFKNCYYFFPKAVDFFTAEMECRKMGGHLASANNDEEAHMIAGKYCKLNFHLPFKICSLFKVLLLYFSSGNHFQIFNSDVCFEFPFHPLIKNNRTRTDCDKRSHIALIRAASFINFQEVIECEP